MQNSADIFAITDAAGRVTYASPSLLRFLGLAADELLGATINEETEEGYTWLGPVPGMPFESLDFVPVPEPKTVKNRIHWDVDTASIEALVEYGATVLREPDDEIAWHVLADPEGNEFCAFLEDQRAASLGDGARPQHGAGSVGGAGPAPE